MGDRASLYMRRNEIVGFVTVSHSIPWNNILDKAGAYLSGAPCGFPTRKYWTRMKERDGEKPTSINYQSKNIF